VQDLTYQQQILFHVGENGKPAVAPATV